MTDIEVVTPATPAAAAAFTVDQRIKNTMRAMKTAWVRLAEDLYAFQQHEMWADLGHDSFDEWLADPEIGIEHRWAYVLIANWREWVVNKGVDPEDLARIEPSKIQELTPAVRRGLVSPQEAISDAEVLSRKDLRQRHGLKAQKHEHTTHYDPESEPVWVICPVCNSRVPEQEISHG